jgi:hypothetical protein
LHSNRFQCGSAQISDQYLPVASPFLKGPVLTKCVYLGEKVFLLRGWWGAPFGGFSDISKRMGRRIGWNELMKQGLCESPHTIPTFLRQEK